jgi:purine-nucleoside phosphorylase
MTHAYAKDYRAIAGEEAAKLGMTLHEGVYAALLGPSYETPAEINYLRTIGADLVGMSTAFEVIAARHMGIKVLAISCVTNMAAGILDQPLSHEEVMETGERVRSRFERLLRAVLPRIESDSDTAS